MATDSSHWHLEIDKQRFDKLKTQERFWQLVALSRAVNALRFVHAALEAHQHEEDSLRASRTRFNSFFFTCALLYEALLLVQRMGKHYRDFPAFSNLQEILKDPLAKRLRESSLAPLRNQLTFHFLEEEVGAQLNKTDMMPRFVSGQGETNADIYYELADACALAAFSEVPLDAPSAEESLGKQIAAATDLAIRFVNASEEFIVEALNTTGWEMTT
jgi:hypothetical protein